LGFALFVKWVKIEIGRKKFGLATTLVKGYISVSREESLETYFSEPYYLGPFSQGEALPLTRSQFQELLELLVLSIYLPQKGRAKTQEILQEIPMPPELRAHLQENLQNPKKG